MAKKYPKLGGILKKLLFDRDMKPIDLARAVNMPPPTVHRLVTGKSSRPYQDTIDTLAAYFDISQDQLLGEAPLTNEEHHHSKHLSDAHIKYIPLVPTDKITTFNAKENTYEKIPCLGDLSDESFAIIMQDSSMSPVFDKGCMLIFDPHKKSSDRSFILAKITENNSVIFRQLLIDLEHKYLKPLNPDLNAFKMRLLGNNDEVFATLVESRQMYNEDIELGGLHETQKIT